MSPRFVRASRPYRRWRLRREQQIRDITVSGHEHLRQTLDAGHGVLLTPNHAAHYDSAALYLAADQIPTPLFFMTAWQVFGMSTRWDQFVMQRLGCFSIDRESSDRLAFKQALTILKHAPHPLVVFPEGDIYHITDRVTPFREGAAAVAIAAARKSDRPISIVPCGIKFWYKEDPTEQLHELMTRLDERLYLRPEPTKPLQDRIYRFAEALLSLKEVEYLGTTQAGPLADRIRDLAGQVLDELEDRLQPRYASSEPTTPGVAEYAPRIGANQVGANQVGANETDAAQVDAAQASIPDRVKTLRQTIIRKLRQLPGTTAANPTGQQTSPTGQQKDLLANMEDLFFVMQLYSYPGDYLLGNPSIERLAETLDKFEEDVFDRDMPSVRGRRRVEIKFGKPIEVSGELLGRSGVRDLTARVQGDVQGLIDELCASEPKVRLAPRRKARKTFPLARFAKRRSGR